MLQRVSYYLTWVFLIVAFLGGCISVSKVIFGASEINKSYAAEQATAEQVAKAYLTVDEEEMEDRLIALSVYPKEVIEKQKAQPDITQKVIHVTALDAIEIDEQRIKVPVDAWAMINRPKKGGKPDETETFMRRLRLSVFLVQKESSFVVDGLPVIEPLENVGAEMTDRVGDPVSPADQSVIEPILKAFLADYYAAKDPLTLKNSLLEGVEIQPLGGFLVFKEITQLSLYSLGEDKYFALCTVSVRDPILETNIEYQMRIGLQKQEEKYFISSLNTQ